MTRLLNQLSVFAILFALAFSANAQETKSKSDDKVEMGDSFNLADEHIELTAPKRWEKIEPRFRMIDAEYQIPAVESEIAGRLTIMGAGGSIEANMDRWKGQFIPPSGQTIDDISKVTKMKVAGQTVHLLDVHGTFNDRPPRLQSGGTKRENYRMLAAIIETEKFGNYFVKFYGNKATVDKAEAEFKALLNSMKIKE